MPITCTCNKGWRGTDCSGGKILTCTEWRRFEIKRTTALHPAANARKLDSRLPLLHFKKTTKLRRLVHKKDKLKKSDLINKWADKSKWTTTMPITCECNNGWKGTDCSEGKILTCAEWCRLKKKRTTALQPAANALGKRANCSLGDMLIKL